MSLDDEVDEVAAIGAGELADGVGVDGAVASEGGEGGLREENVGDFSRV